jgi:DNA-directed RNA polymerase II subunit RPB1
MDKNYAYLMQCQQNVRNIFISGIEGIKTVKTSKKLIFNVNQKDKIDKKNINEFEYVVLETDGSNLKRCLSHFKIDEKKTYCNDMIEIYRVLGIEAARQSFIN